VAHIREPRVLETTTTTGTGALTLAGAVTGYRTFASVMAASDTCIYYIEGIDGSGNATGEYEAGIGTFNTTLTRTTVLRSSNSNNAVTLSAGTKRVGITFFELGTLSPAQITSNQNDYNPTGLDFCTTLRLTTDQPRRIGGLQGGYDGRQIEIQNVNTISGEGIIILNAEDTASTAANRFAIDNDLIFEPGQGGIFTYDGTSQRWRCSAVRRKFTGDTFRLAPFYCTDFLGATGADTGESSYAIWDLSLIGTGPAQAKVAGLGTHPGIISLTSGTTANSGGYIRSDITAIMLAGGEVAEFVFRTPAVFTNTTIRMGFIDTATSADCVDGAYIELPGSGAAVGKTSNNSTRTTSATIATLSASTWYRARVVVNRGATAVDFYIFDEAGNQLGTVNNAANIPTTAGRVTGHGIIATNSGTSATLMLWLDYMSMEWTKALL